LNRFERHHPIPEEKREHIQSIEKNLSFERENYIELPPELQEAVAKMLEPIANDINVPIGNHEKNKSKASKKRTSKVSTKANRPAMEKI
jgi:hypothetical protein